MRSGLVVWACVVLSPACGGDVASGNVKAAADTDTDTDTDSGATPASAPDDAGASNVVSEDGSPATPVTGELPSACAPAGADLGVLARFDAIAGAAMTTENVYVLATSGAEHVLFAISKPRCELTELGSVTGSRPTVGASYYAAYVATSAGLYVAPRGAPLSPLPTPVFPLSENVTVIAMASDERGVSVLVSDRRLQVERLVVLELCCDVEPILVGDVTDLVGGGQDVFVDMSHQGADLFIASNLRPLDPEPLGRIGFVDVASKEQRYLLEDNVLFSPVLAMSGGGVYATDDGIKTITVVGESELVIDSFWRPDTIAADGLGYYWTLRGGIFYAPTRVTPQAPFAATDGPVAWLGVGLDEEYVYWVDAERSRVVRASKPGQ